MITISSVASPESKIVTNKSNSNEPTILYGYGRQQSIVPPSLNELNFPLNPFNVLNTMAVIHPNDDYRSQSPEPSDPSLSSTLLLNLSTIEGWETLHTTLVDATFYSEDKPRKMNCESFSNDRI